MGESARREHLRVRLQDAIIECIEDGWDEDDIRAEVDHTIDYTDAAPPHGGSE